MGFCAEVTTLTSPQMASPLTPVVVTPNASSRPAPPSPSSISGRALSQDKHPNSSSQAVSPNSSRVVTPNASIARPAATQASPISSRTPSHDAPKDSQLSPNTHPRTTREAVQKGTPPSAVVPSSVCVDGARYIIRPMSSKVSRLSSVPVSRHMITGTAPATPRQAPMSARVTIDSPAEAHGKRFTMVDPSHTTPAATSPEAGRFDEISGSRQTVAMAPKTSVAATYHLLAKRKKDAPNSPKPGASTMDQRPIERKVKDPPKITPRQVVAVSSVSSPHYGLRQVITTSTTPRVASPVQVSRVVGSVTSPSVTPRVSPMPRAMAVTMPQARMAYPTAWAYGRH